MKRLFALLILAFLLTACGGEGETTESAASEVTTEPVTEAATEKPKTEKPKTEKPKTEKPKTEAPETEGSATREQKAALKKAENYLDLMAFSDEGLREQLAFEGFPQDAIDYAMENIMVDWNEQARKKAEDYLQLDMGMSDQSLYDQLIFDGFSEEQVQYAMDNLPE